MHEGVKHFENTYSFPFPLRGLGITVILIIGVVKNEFLYLSIGRKYKIQYYTYNVINVTKY